MLVLMAGTMTGNPAVAQTDECAVVEQVFGVGRAGDLIVQPFCATSGGGYLPARTLATFATPVPRLFYGGQLLDNTVVIYGVGDDGALRWYRENGATGRLDPGVVVGSRFGDWRNYEHLQMTGNGDLTGVDAAGRLWRWVHVGWRDGADTWADGGPQDLGTICEGARPIFAGRDGPQRYVGVAAERAPGYVTGYVYCGFDDQVRVASLLPAEVDAMTTAVSPGVSYGLGQGGHRLTRMILDISTTIPQWRVDAVGRDGLTAIFAGCSIVAEGAPHFKYEWQWVWYEETA
jgi:hypothetical protein